MARMAARGVPWVFLLTVITEALVHRTLDYRYLLRGDVRQESARYSYVVDHWFNQKLDHFHHGDTAMWKQRYWVRKEFYLQGGPVFLMLGGEYPADHLNVTAGAWVQYAQSHHAIMFCLEHRFYGRSRPTRDLSVESLAYLSSQQALADAALFIKAMGRKYNLPEDTRWVVFGGSYSGNLAAWLRLKYPHLVTGAVASSAPVLAKLDFTEYFDVVESSLLAMSGRACYMAVREAFQQLDFMIRKTPEILMSQLGLCEPFQSHQVTDVQALFDLMSTAVSKVVQYNDEETNANIPLFCDVMTDQDQGDPLERYNSSMRMVLQLDRCKDFSYREQIDKVRNVTFGDDSDRPWLYQTCTEFGYYQTSETRHALLGKNLFLKFFTNVCSDVFGRQFTRRLIQDAVDHTNMVYGGLELQATRVIHVHGSLDPWHVLGITHTRALVPESPAILVNGSAHCQDMREERPGDLPGLIKSRQQINRIIGEWLLE